MDFFFNHGLHLQDISPVFLFQAKTTNQYFLFFGHKLASYLWIFSFSFYLKLAACTYNFTRNVKKKPLYLVLQFLQPECNKIFMEPKNWKLYRRARTDHLNTDCLGTGVEKCWQKISWAKQNLHYASFSLNFAPFSISGSFSISNTQL